MVENCTDRGLAESHPKCEPMDWVADSEKKVADQIIGVLIAEDKYKFADHNLIAEVVRDTLRLA